MSWVRWRWRTVILWHITGWTLRSHDCYTRLMTKKTKHLGNESGKSSNKYFGGEGHPKGNGASAGDGKTSDTSILGKIKVIFKS